MFFRYCGRACQRSEFKKHNDDCQFIKNTIDDLAKIEETYKQFKLSSTGAPQNIWQTQVGDFWVHANDQFWEKDGSRKNVWPRDYLKLRHKLVTALWRVADTNLGMDFFEFSLHFLNCCNFFLNTSNFFYTVFHNTVRKNIFLTEKGSHCVEKYFSSC